MNATPLRSTTPTIDIYVRLAQYPVLADKIRARMRQEMFQRGIITPEAFKAQVKEIALESQRREGLVNPFEEEEPTQWQKRKDRIRDFHTDAFFAETLGASLLDEIIRQVLASQPVPAATAELSFNPEIAPWDLLFAQGERYEQLRGEERQAVEHHLEEIKVVLIKRMISDQLPYIGIAKKIFSIADLRRVFRRRIGGGKIGGKAAGMLLAWKILQTKYDDGLPDIHSAVEIPDSYFLGTEAIYEFRLINGLDRLMNQKYRPIAETREEYPAIVEAHLAGRFPQKVVERLRGTLAEFGDSPIIVRSSSLLEDNFGFSFAGKYNSYFCPNQGTPEENLDALLSAVKKVYASTLNPDALLYRRNHGLIDYDERMAVLIQRLRGKPHGRFFYPSLAGVAFSQNPFRWNKKIRREDGFLRLVWGLGTRAVDRVSNDYPRLIALSHPQLRPETTPAAIRQYSQWFIDAIDLESNAFVTMPIRDALTPDFPDLRYIASISRGDYLQDILSLGSVSAEDEFVLTFNYLTKDQTFIQLMKTALQRLEKVYATPVDVEFTVEVIPTYPYPEYRLHMLQCRPLSQRKNSERVTIPKEISAENVLFTSHRLVPDGKAEGIRYVVFVDPERYRKVGDMVTKQELGRAVSRLNRILEDERFILMGPGRWGSANIDLGVSVGYGDIHNTKVLIEIAVAHNGHVPELSYGTHFFQDLVESGIYSLPLHLAEGEGSFDWDYFRTRPNQLATLSPEDAALSDYLRVIDVTISADGSTNMQRRLNIYMDGSADEAVGFLSEGQWQKSQSGISTVNNRF